MENRKTGRSLIWVLFVSGVILIAFGAGAIACLIYVISNLSDTPSEVQNILSNKNVRNFIEKDERVLSVSGGSDGRSLAKGVLVSRVSIFAETDIDEREFREFFERQVKKLVEGECKVVWHGGSRWSVPLGLSLYYVIDKRFGAVHSIFIPYGEGYRVMMIVQEGPDASAIFKPLLSDDEELDL